MVSSGNLFEPRPEVIVVGPDRATWGMGIPKSNVRTMDTCPNASSPCLMDSSAPIWNVLSGQGYAEVLFTSAGKG